MTALLRDRGLSALVEDGSDLRTIASGLQFTEGPLGLADGSVLFQDIKAERTYRVDREGLVTVLRDRTEAANGQTFDPSGRVVFCEQNGRRVSRMNPDGTGVEVVAETWQGQRLNSPNDIVAHPDGWLVFTDPPYGVKPPDRAIPFSGVFALDEPGPSEPRLLIDDFEKPNGLAFSPDGSTLYVCDTGRYHVRAFQVDEGRSIIARSDRVFCTLDPGQAGGPDGLKVDGDGRVYVAVALGVWVFEPSGVLLGILSTPARPSNLAWTGSQGSTLVITAVDQVHQIDLKVRGLLPPFLPRSA